MEDRARLLLLVLLAAFGLRLGLGLALRKNTFAQESYHLAIARELAAGRGHVLPGTDWTSAPSPAVRTPLYHLLLAGVIRVFGENESLIVCQALIGTITVWLVALLGRELFSPKAGLCAAVLAALYPYYAVNDTGLIDRALFTLALSAATLASLRLYGGGTWKSAFVTGSIWAAAALVRPTGIIFPPFVAAWLMRGEYWSSRRAILLAGLAGGFMAALSPWLARNGLIYGRPVFVSQGGLQLWAGQAALAEDCGYPDVALERCMDMAYAKFPQTDREALRRYDERGQDRFFLHSALDFIRRNPASVVKNMGLKLWGAFSPIPNPRLDRDLRLRHGRLAAAVHAVSYAVLAVAALAALWKWRRHPEVWISACMFASFTLCTLVFWSHTAHRAALDFLLIVLASGNLEPAPLRPATPKLIKSADVGAT